MIMRVNEANKLLAKELANITRGNQLRDRHIQSFSHFTQTHRYRYMIAKPQVTNQKSLHTGCNPLPFPLHLSGPLAGDLGVDPCPGLALEIPPVPLVVVFVPPLLPLPNPLLSALTPLLSRAL